ncbi:MAG: MotA/TolQ/ExbB proton channel family protein, partial [Candidatus Eremiobacteraeota bacterium]|nr:MotA/TolQ/ExbB proton channel family protein [Candidatus Eremiobacteraeota bacterium]
VEQIMMSSVARERQRFDRFLTYFGTLGNNAPFIGLFGTVLGIIRAFHNLSGDLTGGADVVMGAISEALVATAARIFVAIPALAAYNGFQRKVEQLHALALGPAPAEGRVD